jgi:hypothetical protein
VEPRSAPICPDLDRPHARSPHIAASTASSPIDPETSDPETSTTSEHPTTTGVGGEVMRHTVPLKPTSPHCRRGSSSNGWASGGHNGTASSGPQASRRES